MKSILLLFMLLTAGITANAQANKACIEKHKIGTYVYQDSTMAVVITRTKNRQISVDKKTGEKMIAKVVWVTDDEFLLIVKKDVDGPGCLRKGDRIVNKIVECNEDGYVSHYSMAACGHGIETFKRIK